MMLNKVWNEYTDLINRKLAELYGFATASQEPQKELFDSMYYSLSAGGKRLRPYFAMEFCRACGAEPEKALPAALAAEMVHTYSLIHDDLPCMDNDTLRRGKPTNHVVFGETMALLAGDALLTDAFRVLTGTGLPAETAGRCAGILASNAGSFGMVGGQVLDLSAEQRECTAEDVLAIQLRKTSALFRAACCMGVVCAGGTAEQVSAAERYADALGMAFQIRDDILDATSTAEVLGKSVGTDEAKNTFVKIAGIQGAEKLLAGYTEEAIDALRAFSGENTLREMAEFLAHREK